MAYVTNGGEMQLEAEDMSGVSYPRQGFVKPVRLAVIWYGIKKEQPPAEAEQERDRDHYRQTRLLDRSVRQSRRRVT